ncbi:MAG: nucleotidyltransferase domain-containing protein [Cyanobacteria bacterium J06627_32]
MGKTVSQLTPEELKRYDPTRNLKKGLDAERWARAQAKLPEITALLREQFDVERVRVFGSLIDKDRYTRWSDIDIAVWGLAPERYYSAVGAVNDLAEDIKVDIVDFLRCSSHTLRQIIEEEGIDL